jgi:hypothetical protein
MNGIAASIIHLNVCDGVVARETPMHQWMESFTDFSSSFVLLSLTCVLAFSFLQYH